MKTLFPIVLAAVLAAPVQADDCSDFRRSVRERDAAVALLSKPATDEETAGELVSGAALAYQRRDAAERALLANRGDDSGCGHCQIVGRGPHRRDHGVFGFVTLGAWTGKIRPPSDSSARSCRSFLQSRRCAMPWSTRCASSSAVARILASRTS